MGLRVMVYSHDTFGLGNIRRMLAIAEHIVATIPGASVLLVTGSPMIHGFRIGPGLDYIKLPCLSRVGRDQYLAKSLGTEIGQLIHLRAGLILAAARDFEPDVVLVDKKPDGIKHELRPTLGFLSRERPECKLALVLRDILDAPKTTIASWRKHGVEDTLRKYFHSVLILGDSQVFDAPREYRFSASLRRMVKFCGYLRRQTPGAAEVATLRTRLLSAGESRLVLVTPGGGEDGLYMVSAYVAGMGRQPNVRSVIVCGPEMPVDHRAEIEKQTLPNPGMTVMEFSGEMVNLLASADVVVSMAGYNTICEVLSLGKRAVTVPRAHPVLEQWIRAARLDQMGLLKAIHPDSLTPENLASEVMTQLAAKSGPARFPANLDGLNGVAAWVSTAAPRPEEATQIRRFAWQALHTF